MNYVLGVDFGGSSSKATLLGEDGNVYATASREYPTYYPQNGWAEQDADDSYDALVWNMSYLIAGSSLRAIIALQMDTCQTIPSMESQSQHQ